MPDQRIRFSKSGPACYISHLDLMRTFQRAFLRAGIHIRHTEGFNPHAYVSIPLPLSVGFSSQCEIMEFGLAEETDKASIPWRLTRALPEGIIVTKCYDGVRPFKELGYVNYIVTLEYDAGAPVGAENTIRSLLSHKVDYEGRRDTVVLDMILKAQNPGLNPTLLISTIQSECPELTPDYVSYHRKQVLDMDFRPYE